MGALLTGRWEDRDAEADPYPYMCEADDLLEVEVPL
jgi:hypothetical protein